MTRRASSALVSALSRRWFLLVPFFFTLKLLLSVFFTPVCCDFVNWIYTASFFFNDISRGVLPQTLIGPYAGINLLLSAFFAIWTLLPVSHPSLYTFIGCNYPFVPSTPAYLLLALMKLPILLFDLITGLIAYLIARRTTGSSSMAAGTFLLWYLNPYNFYLMSSWDNPGAFDVIPAAVVLMAVLFAVSKRWASAGISLSAATILRVFPIILFPFFMIYALRHGYRASARFIFTFLGLLALAILPPAFLTGSLSTLANSILSIPVAAPWVLEYYTGIPLVAFLSLTAFALFVQLYIVVRYWRTSAPVTNWVLVALLAFLTVTYHEPYHFIWVIPLLTIYCAINRNALPLFVLTCVTGFLSNSGFSAPLTSMLFVLEPLLAGLFYGVKAVYLIRVNLDSIRSQPVNSAHGLAAHQFMKR